MRQKFSCWSVARRELREADMLLFRGSYWNPQHLVIMGLTGSPYIHAGMVGFRSNQLNERWANEPTVQEMLEFRGGREVSLKDQVEAWPGRWDHYRLRPRNLLAFDLAVGAMEQFIGHPYGWWNLLVVGLRHLPIVRLFLPAQTDDQIQSGSPPYCSDALARAYRQAGEDPVPNRPDRLTTPGDLSRSLLFQYVATLTPDAKP